MGRYERRQLFDPLNDKWAAPWLRKMIFAPIFLLQLINLFWYFLILRILYRYVFPYGSAWRMGLTVQGGLCGAAEG